jgi:hypothetical protein
LSQIFRARLACRGALRGACNALLALRVGVVAASRLDPDGDIVARAVQAGLGVVVKGGA